MTDLKEFDIKVRDTETNLYDSKKLFTSCIQDAEGEVGAGLTAMQTLLKRVHKGIRDSTPDFGDLMTEMESCSDPETIDLKPKMRLLADKAGAALTNLEDAEEKSEKALRLVMTYHSRFSDLSQDIMAQQQGLEARSMEATKLKATADAALVIAESSLVYAQSELEKADQAVQEHQKKVYELQNEVNGKHFSSLGVGATQVVTEEVAKATKKHVWFGGGVAVLGTALLPLSFGLSSGLIAAGASYATGSAIVHVGAASASEATQKKYDELQAEISQIQTKLEGLRIEQSRKQASLWTSQTKVNTCKQEKLERGREIEHIHDLQSHITQMHRNAGVMVTSTQSYEDGMQVLKHALDGCTYALSEKVILLKDEMEERPRLRKVDKQKEFIKDQRAILAVINTLCSTAQAVQGLLERTEVKFLLSRQ